MNSSKSEPRFDVVIVRFGGEIGIKAAWTRRLYERRLISNIKAFLKQQGIEHEALNRKFGRLFIRTSDAKETCQALNNVFGVSSVSPAVKTTSQLNDIVEKGILVAGSVLREKQTFAVRCRRVGSHAYTSQDVCRHVGQAVLDAYANRELRVDLGHPDLTLEVEVREDGAYVFTETMKGPGGLPLGVQPKIVGLLNSDVNSLVACWMVMKRGCPIIPLHFIEHLQDSQSQRKALESAKTLFKWAPGFPTKAYIVSHEAYIAKINKSSSSTRKLKSVLLRRLTYRVAKRLAETWRAEGIVTGDSFPKPAGEKLHLYRLYDEAASCLPIHRPLIGLDAPEIKELAQRIGINRKFSDEGKRQKAPRVSGGKISLKAVKAAEVKLNVDGMVESSLESLRTITLR
jgi:thiamine biosynthesis protein ThiI